MCDACRGEKKTFDPLELELWMIVSSHVGAGKGPISFTNALKCQAISSVLPPSPHLLFKPVMDFTQDKLFWQVVHKNAKNGVMKDI